MEYDYNCPTKKLILRLLKIAYICQSQQKLHVHSDMNQVYLLHAWSEPINSHRTQDRMAATHQLSLVLEVIVDSVSTDG